MKNLALLILTIFTIQVRAQVISEAKNDLKQLSIKFVTLKAGFDAENDKLKLLKEKISVETNDSFLKELNNQIKKTQKKGFSLDSISKIAENYKAFYLNKSEDKSQSFLDSLTKYFPYKFELNKIDQPATTQKTLLYFGKDKVIDEQDAFFKDKKYNLIFSDVLEAKSENYLGDFIIPQRGQRIIANVTEKQPKDKVKSINKEDINYLIGNLALVPNNFDYAVKKGNNSLYFKNIKIHITEGSLDEIQLFVTDENNNELLFENKIPISLLRATDLFSKNSLFFKTATSNNKATPINISLYKNYRIMLSEALVYIPNPGDNYIPEDLTLEFPTQTDGNDDNINNAIKYKVNQDTSLKNIVELRTYTDFLGLFTENSPNGIVQLEGKADFFIAPSIASVNYPSYFFKKISPFVNFSKIEKDARNVSLAGDAGSQTIKNSLDILQKSYLKMGLNLSLFSFKIKKEFPLEINIYTSAKYQISDVMKIDSTIVDYKSFGLGGGLAFENKRYNNFGFIYSIDFTNYNVKSFNTMEGIINPDRFWVFKNEAEVYYYPNKTKQQSIFLRLKTFNDMTKGNNEAFYQLQFGYRFSIGVSKIKQ